MQNIIRHMRSARAVLTAFLETCISYPGGTRRWNSPFDFVGNVF